MSPEPSLLERADNKCELCGNDSDLSAYEVSNAPEDAENNILLCITCKSQIEETTTVDVHHWRCLADSMWTPVPAVQVMAWRMLNRLHDEAWARDLLETLYLGPETEHWAKQGANDADDQIKHIDSNGATLSAGDTVVLIKDLNVKGANFTAKRGTAVRNISLDPNNEKHIEGRVEGQQIVILTEFVKKK